METKRVSILLFIVLNMMATVVGATDLSTFRQSSKNDCGIIDYVTKFHVRHPVDKVYADDLGRFVDATENGQTYDALIRIDKDLTLKVYARTVLQCMNKFSSLESTIQRLYALYLSENANRSAYWFLIKQLDDVYLSQNQRAENVYRRDSFAPNFIKAATWGSLVTAVILTFRSGKIPLLGRANLPQVGSNLTPQHELILKSLRWSRIKNYISDLGQFSAMAGVTGGLGGGALYYAKQRGWIATQDRPATERLEELQHRLHWFELDCRVLRLRAALSGKEYVINPDGSSPELSKDAASMNQLLADFNFLADVSHLYYMASSWPADAQVSREKIAYKGQEVTCTGGFSADPANLTPLGIRKSLSGLSLSFLQNYARLLVQPATEQIEKIIQKVDQSIEKKLQDSKNQPSVLYRFFSQATKNQNQIPELSEKQTIERLVLDMNVNVDPSVHTQLRELHREFVSQLPEEDKNDLIKTLTQIQRQLPIAIQNAVTLKVYRKQPSTLGRMFVLFQMGDLIQMKAEAKLIKDDTEYLRGDHLVFNRFGDLQALP